MQMKKFQQLFPRYLDNKTPQYLKGYIQALEDVEELAQGEQKKPYNGLTSKQHSERAKKAWAKRKARLAQEREVVPSH